MKRIWCLFVGLAIFGLASSNAFAANLGKVSGAWEVRGHWETAGNLGAVCEHRPGSRQPFKVKVYQLHGNLYQEFESYRFWPESCNVTVADFPVTWRQLGTFVLDSSLPAMEDGEKGTMKRWIIQ